MYCLFFGLRGTTIAWIMNYLSNRFQQVVIGIAFIINCICESPKLLLLIQFAADTSAFISGYELKLLTETINDELIILSKWLKVNKLSTNLKKTNYILFSGIRK